MNSHSILPFFGNVIVNPDLVKAGVRFNRSRESGTDCRRHKKTRCEQYEKPVEFKNMHCGTHNVLLRRTKLIIVWVN